MHFRWRSLWTSLAAVALTLLTATPLQAQSVDESLKATHLYGINRATGEMSRYDFVSRSSTFVGLVQTSTGTVLTGVDAATYFPGFQNIFVLWANPADNKNKLVYTNAATAESTIVTQDVEGGRFTGAASLNTSALPWTVFAIQQAKVKPPVTITGLINLNPNNSYDNEFVLIKPDGSRITRDTLHADTTRIQSDGTYYRGEAASVHVKPKGNGNQNSLIIDGQAYKLQNSNTYDFAGTMQVRLYNDHDNGAGKAIGQWWIQIVSGQVHINNEVQVLTPHRIATVNHRDGTVNEIMPLSLAYAGLATLDGKIFYTTSGQDFYRIDTAAQTETKVGTMSLRQVSSLAFVGPHLLAYDIMGTALGVLDPATGRTLGTPANLGLGQLGVILFAPRDQAVALQAAAYD